MLQDLQARGVIVLVTSRRSLGANLGRAAQLRLGALSPVAGAELLTDLAGVEWGAGEAESLVHICGGNPLAIKILAGFLSGQQCTPKVCSNRSSPVQDVYSIVLSAVKLNFFACTDVVHLDC